MNNVLRKLKQLFPDGKQSKRWYNINCLFCQNRGFKKDTGYHFGINYHKGYTNCFKCGAKYKLTYFLKIIRIDFDIDDFVFDETPLVRTKTVIHFPKEFINTLDLFDSRYPNYIEALEYIDKRIGIDLALKLNIGFCSTGVYANRIVVPVFDVGDNIVYFVARAIYNYIEPKIKNPPGARGSVMYNWNIAQNFSEIYLMEGVFGALTVYPYGVATFGKEVTDEQILAILRSDVKIVNIVLDGNAIQNAYLVAKRIQNFTSKIKIRVFELRHNVQPDDLSFEHLIKMKEYIPFYKRMF